MTIQNIRATDSEWTASNPVLSAGEIGYESNTGLTKIGDGTTAWNLLPYITLPSGGTDGQILARTGTQSTTWIDNYSTQTKHQVKLGEAVTKGQAVYVSSANGTNMIVSKASNASESTSSKVLGLVQSSGSTNDFVYVVTQGLLANIDTSTATAGNAVWLGTSGNLIFTAPPTNTGKPVAPAHLVFIGVVTRANQNEGEIFVNIQNGFELDELHDVLVDAKASIADNEILAFDSGSQLWKNQTPVEANLASSHTAGAVSYGVPTGAVMMWYSGSIPSGWQLCDGALGATAELRAVLSSSSGYTPNFNGRVPIGPGYMVDARGEGRNYSLTNAGGEFAHVLSMEEMPSHNHSTTLQEDDWFGTGTSVTLDDDASGSSGATAYPSDYRGSSWAHNNMQPFLAIYYIIKT